MKTKSILIACVMAFCLAISANAQETQTQQANLATVAKIDISDAKVAKQEGNKLTIGFDIKNGDVYQPQVAYSLKISRTEERVITLMDQKTYSDKIDLESGKIVHKEITYEVPVFLAGKYDLEIEVKSFSGFLLAIGRIDGISFSGNGGYISINGISCKTADGKSIIEQGMFTTEKGKSIEVTCEIENKAKDAINVSTVVDIYQNKVFSFGNSVLQNSVGSQVQINGGEKKTLSFIVPKIDAAQSYVALFSLQDEKKNRISDIAGMRLLIKGDAFLVDNVMFDKQAYAAGDAAEVLIVWDRNLDKIDGREQAPFEAYLADENGSSCSNETVKSVHKRGDLSSKISLPVNVTCKNPKIILNGIDVIYSQKVEKKVSAANDGKDMYLENNKKLLGTLLFIVLVGCLLLIGFAVNKRKSGSGLKMFLFFCFVLGMNVAFSNEVSAGDFYTAKGTSVWFAIGVNWDNTKPNNGFNTTAYGNGVCSGNHFPPYVAGVGGSPYDAATPGKNLYYTETIFITPIPQTILDGGTERMVIKSKVGNSEVILFDKNIGREYIFHDIGSSSLRINDYYANPFPTPNKMPNIVGKYTASVTVEFEGASGTDSKFVVVIDPKEPKCGSAATLAFANAPSSNLCTDSLIQNAPYLSSGKWMWSCESTCDFSSDSYPFWDSEYCYANTGCGPYNGAAFISTPTGATSNFCNDGTFSGLSGSGPWTWTCSGLADGTANCSASKPLPPCIPNCPTTCGGGGESDECDGTCPNRPPCECVTSYSNYKCIYPNSDFCSKLENCGKTNTVTPSCSAKNNCTEKYDSLPVDECIKNGLSSCIEKTENCPACNNVSRGLMREVAP